MNRERKLPFDPKAFLSKVNGGRAISDYRKDQNVHTQGERADSVFYIQSGKVKKTVVSEQGKEAAELLNEDLAREYQVIIALRRLFPGARRRPIHGHRRPTRNPRQAHRSCPD
jgi:hypothetical protein